MTASTYFHRSLWRQVDQVCVICHGWCRRSQVRIASELGLARSTVQAALDRLAALGVVEKHEGEEREDGGTDCHCYRLKREVAR